MGDNIHRKNAYNKWPASKHQNLTKPKKPFNSKVLLGQRGRKSRRKRLLKKKSRRRHFGKIAEEDSSDE